MKKFLLVGLFLFLMIPHASAQWGGGGDESGRVLLHRDTRTSADPWYSTVASTITTLKGYEKARIDFDLTHLKTAEPTVKANLQCNNGSVWVSGDSLTANGDSYELVDLGVCSGGYRIWIESMHGVTSASIYVTGINLLK